MASTMEKHIKFIAFIFLILCMSCQKTQTEDDSPEYIVFAHEILNTLAHEMEKEYGLHCIGNGGGMPHDVEELSVNFIAYQRASIDEARELEVKVTERFLEIINSHKNIRPFLREYPFTVHRAEVSIAFNRKDNTRYS